MSNGTALLALTSWALAANAPPLAPPQCTIGTLTGHYVFTGSGFIEPIEPGIQRLHYGMFRFDGGGTLSGKQSSSRGGNIGRETLEGTYTMSPDCSGTMTFRFNDVTPWFPPVRIRARQLCCA
jgi:hypothetical protein